MTRTDERRILHASFLIAMEMCESEKALLLEVWWEPNIPGSATSEGVWKYRLGEHPERELGEDFLEAMRTIFEMAQVLQIRTMGELYETNLQRLEQMFEIARAG